ncbi:MAG TPA: AI-2E family transporter [Noviherbaspirillum sp.]|uniref:AI-2E family transporter n=1 Tax=Noviherbaspirillum sp. TaxID=1926288 RepID=UPI002D426DB7|nr:AI-2E family transporter [Noviherbaspirillum sp.]HYD94910.1 AI-2E family transporter [Noviherbaspirillum sp.]
MAASPDSRTGALPVGDRRVLADRRASYRLAAAETLEFSDTQFFRRTMLVVALVLFTGLMLALIWYASDVLLVLFSGILFAVLLRAPTNWLAQHAGLRTSAALALSIGALAAVIMLLVYLFAVPMAAQVAQMIETLPQAADRLQDWMEQHRWARPLRPLIAELSRFRLDSQLLGRAGGFLTSTLSAITGAGVALFIGIYLAAQPRLYQRGLMHLLPRKNRPRAYEVMDEIGAVLRWWLAGRLATMTVVGVAAGIGLWLLGVPLAFTLGVLTGVLEFVPYIGPILAAVPPLLISYNADPELGFYVLMLYAAIQGAENYLLTPLIEQRAVALPPALVIFSTLLLGALSGPLGVVLASPITATAIVAVKLLYVEDVVEQPKPKL